MVKTLGYSRFAYWIVLACLVAGCSSDAPTLPRRRHNIVLITVDTLRADRLTPYGYDKIDTPAIEQLAREGILFEKAFADTSWTLPSLSSVMTGQYPTSHRVRSWNNRLEDSHHTVAEILKAQGYKTAGIVGSYPLDRYFGLGQGFDYYDDKMTQALFADAAPRDPAKPTKQLAPDASAKHRAIWQMTREKTNAYRTDTEVADAAIEWLRENQAEPFLLWVHFFGPHEKGKRTGLEKGEREAHIAEQIARYDPAVAEMDTQVGRLLGELRKSPTSTNTAIIFHSDHGQSLKEHGWFGHGMDLFDTNVHIPLIVRLPGADRAGERIQHVVRNLDIFATILDLANLPPEKVESQSLLATNPRRSPHAFVETYHTLSLFSRKADVDGRERRVGTILHGLRTADAKLVRSIPALAPSEDSADPLPPDYVSQGTSTQMFDMKSDPGETRNQASKEADRLNAMIQLLQDHQTTGSENHPRHQLDEAAKERLRSLGYPVPE